MKKIYMDNGASSYPKAPGVADMMREYIEEIGSNINRGGYSSAYTAAGVVLDTRERLASLFHFKQVENVVFTLNITQSLNFIIKGFLKPGDHCIITSMEHNAVMRPLMQMQKKGVVFTRVPCNTQGKLNPDDLKASIQSNTKAVIMLHSSNVCGTIMPVEAVGEMCKAYGIKFILDTAQTAGILDIDFHKLNLSALTFTGHKSLLGPQGTGGFIVTDELAAEMESLISGGTGSLSDEEEVPAFMPDKFESGTINLPGIFGLNAALKYLEQYGIDNIRAKETELTDRFLLGIKEIPGIKIIGPDNSMERTAVVSLDFIGRDNAEISYTLDNEYGIMTRCGLHCAPSAHKTLGTFPHGTVRFSFGHFNTKEEIDYALEAIKKLI